MSQLSAMWFIIGAFQGLFVWLFLTRCRVGKLGIAVHDWGKWKKFGHTFQIRYCERCGQSKTRG